ncbi:MAG: lipid-A-disaccharide synthase N-terminal domain-containing protein [Tepidisphaeraceae bacterium]
MGLSSPVVLFWLTVGFVGQLLFTGRFVVQYIASERKKKSVVPPVFWWFSLIGSLILLSYFLWRRDPIGLLGQAFGSFIYLRNILWIRNESRPSVLTVPEAS